MDGKGRNRRGETIRRLPPTQHRDCLETRKVYRTGWNPRPDTRLTLNKQNSESIPTLNTHTKEPRRPHKPTHATARQQSKPITGLAFFVSRPENRKESEASPNRRKDRKKKNASQQPHRKNAKKKRPPSSTPHRRERERKKAPQHQTDLKALRQGRNATTRPRLDSTRPATTTSHARHADTRGNHAANPSSTHTA